MNLKIRINFLLMGISLFIQSSSVLMAQKVGSNDAPEVSIFKVDGEINISINFNEPFRWEGTRYESVKKFPQPWIGFPDLPHEIRFEKGGEMTWRQTDMVFLGAYKVQESSGAELLNQYLKKHGGFGIRTWSVNKEGNLKSFNEFTGSYEILSPKEFATRYELDFKTDKLSIEASVNGYLLKIMGLFNLQKNLLSFDDLDYTPFFPIPNLRIEESIDLKDWAKVILPNELPSEYQWPHGLNLNLGSIKNKVKFYRVRVLSD